MKTPSENDLGRLVIFASLMLLPRALAQDCFPNLPPPLVAQTGFEGYGTHQIFDLTVMNRAQFPSELFAAAPDLPPCGLNSSSARTWVALATTVNVTGVFDHADVGSANLPRRFYRVIEQRP